MICFTIFVFDKLFRFDSTLSDLHKHTHTHVRFIILSKSFILLHCVRMSLNVVSHKIDTQIVLVASENLPCRSERFYSINIFRNISNQIVVDCDSALNTIENFVHEICFRLLYIIIAFHPHGFFCCCRRRRFCSVKYRCKCFIIFMCLA